MNAVRSDSVDFFLGTTTPAGFKGYFEPLRREPGMQMYIIKSGPGCGKSTLMKRLAVKAEQRGEPIQQQAPGRCDIPRGPAAQGSVLGEEPLHLVGVGVEGIGVQCVLLG